MSERRIIDAHHHLGEQEDYADRLAETCGKLHIVKVCLVSLNIPDEGGNNARTKRAFEEYPDLFVGFGGVNLWENDAPEQVQRLYEDGFKGLKFILPPKPYHDPSFYPAYERAQKLGMPALFHLGIVARKPGRTFRVDNNLMRPVYLDTIARAFPGLTLIGAHLGNPWYDEAVMSCRWNPNLYFDLSGSTLKKKTPEFLASLLWWTSTTFYGDAEGREAWEKIVFGSDVDWPYVKDVLNDYEQLMRAVHLRPDLRESVLYGTMASILGLDQD